MDNEKEISFGAFDSELMHQEIFIPEGFTATIDGNKIILKKIESEDEKIRKALVRFHKGTIDIDGIKGDDILAWLEKQGQKLTDDEMTQVLRTEYEKGRADAFAQMQKEWSEEDEEMFEYTINLLNYNLGCRKWLKSLKERYTWKPSDEQMHALHDLNLTGNISYVGQGQELINLYNDLKKLKGK